MPDNSLAKILEWMKTESRMLKWGMIAVLERSKTNLIIAQEYSRRFNSDSYLPPVTGEIVISEDRRMEVITDFVMDKPVMSFKNADLNDSKAELAMRVMGGSQLTLEKESVGWKAYKVDEVDPLQGPVLYLDLLLNEVPGVVDERRVRLDLSKSDNFRLTFGSSQHEQRMGGDFFKDLFRTLPDKMRIYTLGTIEQSVNVIMDPRSFELRTQASSAAARDPLSAEYENGAVLVLVETGGSKRGNYPGENYKFLIPDDAGKDYSATVLLDSSLLFMSLLIWEFGNLIGSSEFEYKYNEFDDLISATALGGGFEFPGKSYSETLHDPDYEEGVYISVSFAGIQISAASALNILIEESDLHVSWAFAGESTLAGVAETSPIQTIKYPVSYTGTIDVAYSVVDEGKGAGLKMTDCNVVLDIRWPDIVKGDGTILPPDFWGRMAGHLRNLVDAEDETEIVESKLTSSFPIDLSANDIVQEVVRLNFGQAIQSVDIKSPRDIGLFGRINPQQTSFVISPLHPVIRAGDSHAFTTTPAVTGLKWEVEGLAGEPGDPGSIHGSSGVYQPPPASAIKGRFIRVRVTATDPDSGYSSRALATVVVNELSVHPLIQICDVDATVKLAAGALDGGSLQWSIKNPVPGESGELEPSDNSEDEYTYRPSPPVSGKTYVLDEIEVKNPRTQGTHSVHVLALQKKPMLDIRIDRIDVDKGEVQLTALFDGEPEDADWSIKLGPGSFSSPGLYKTDPTAIGRYALVFAEMSFGNRTLEGHVIVPLPLHEVKKMLEESSR